MTEILSPSTSFRVAKRGSMDHDDDEFNGLSKRVRNIENEEFSSSFRFPERTGLQQSDANPKRMRTEENRLLSCLPSPIQFSNNFQPNSCQPNIAQKNNEIFALQTQQKADKDEIARLKQLLEQTQVGNKQICDENRVLKKAVAVSTIFYLLIEYHEMIL